MPQSPKHAYELWWDDTDGGRLQADRRRRSLDSHLRHLSQQGYGVRAIADELEGRTGGRVRISHSTVHRWMKLLDKGESLS